MHVNLNYYKTQKRKNAFHENISSRWAEMLYYSPLSDIAPGDQ